MLPCNGLVTAFRAKKLKASDVLVCLFCWQIMPSLAQENVSLDVISTSEAQKIMEITETSEALEIAEVAEINSTIDAVNVTALASEFFLQAQMAEMVNNSEEAIQKYDQAIELDPDNLLYRIAKASLQRAQYQHSEAKSTLIDVLPLLGYAKTVDLPMFIYNELGELERELGSVESAISWYQKSLAVALSLEPLPQEALLPLYNNLGLMNLKLANYDQSQSYFEKALLLADIPIESYDIYQWQLSGWLTTIINISSLQVSLGLLNEAGETLEKALQRYNEILEPDIRASRYLGLKLTILQKQSNILQALGNTEQAQVVRLQTLEQTKRLYGETHNQVALVLGELGAYAIALGRVAQAIKYYQQALAVFAALGDTDSQAYLQIQQSYADLLSQQELSDLTTPEQ